MTAVPEKRLACPQIAQGRPRNAPRVVSCTARRLFRSPAESGNPSKDLARLEIERATVKEDIERLLRELMDLCGKVAETRPSLRRSHCVRQRGPAALANP
jgi:hypothetical protein